MVVSIFCRRVRKARQYPRVIYIPRELTSRSSTNLDRHCATLMKPHEGLSAQPLFERSSSSFGESVRRGGGGRSGKENLKVQLAVLRLPMEGDSKMVFEGDSLCSSKVIRGMQVCVVVVRLFTLYAGNRERREMNESVLLGGGQE